MKTYKIIILSVIIFLISYACVNSNSKMSIQQLKFLDTTISKTINKSISTIKFVSYQIVNFNDNTQSLSAINLFIRSKHPFSELKLYDEYTITFYLPALNIDSLVLKNHPDRYYNQDNTIYEYKWLKGKLVSKYKFNNGVIVEPKDNIKIKEITY